MASKHLAYMIQTPGASLLVKTTTTTKNVFDFNKFFTSFNLNLTIPHKKYQGISN